MHSFRSPSSVPEETEAFATQAVDVVVTVRRKLGAGLPERFYQRAMEIELARRGLPYRAKPEIEVRYDDELLGKVIPDVMVGDDLVIELKAVEEFAPIHQAQLLTYLKISRARLGLLINFHAIPIRTGIVRYVNTS